MYAIRSYYAARPNTFEKVRNTSTLSYLRAQSLKSYSFLEYSMYAWSIITSASVLSMIFLISSFGITFPVGLFGVHKNIAFVFSVMLFKTLSTSSLKPFSLSNFAHFIFAP